MLRGYKRAAALLAAVMVALGIGGVAAFAQDSGLGGENSLTITVSASSDDGVGDVDVVADVYRIGSATKTQGFDAYDYALDESLSSIASKYDLASMGGAQWQALADEAATLAEGLARVGERVPAGELLEGLTDGLYLVVAPAAYGTSYEYAFNPTIVALPTKEPLTDDNGNVIVDEDGYPIINSAADYGAWTGNATVALKHSREPLYGSIRIVKTVRDFSGEQATFVFHLQGTQPDGRTYDNYASITYAGGDSAETMVTHIPAGTVLTVTEDYSGARYRLVEGDTTEKTIVADVALGENGQGMASASFVNEPNGSGKGGHGINNNFEQGANGDWPWTATPAQGQQ